MAPGLGLAAFGTGKSAVETLIYIIKTVQNVRKLKKQCEKVGELARLLQTVLNGNEKALEDMDTAIKLRLHLRNVAIFVTNCTKTSSFIERTWEVMWVKKHPRLLGEMKDWVLYFLMDASVVLSYHYDIAGS